MHVLAGRQRDSLQVDSKIEGEETKGEDAVEVAAEVVVSRNPETRQARGTTGSEKRAMVRLKCRPRPVSRFGKKKNRNFFRAKILARSHFFVFGKICKAIVFRLSHCRSDLRVLPAEQIWPSSSALLHYSIIAH